MKNQGNAAQNTRANLEGLGKTANLTVPRPFSKTVHSDFSGHALYVREVDIREVALLSGVRDYKQFYEVRNFDASGVVFMYLAKGLATAPKEIVAWYPNGQFWSSYGTSLKSAIEGAQKDGWLHAV